VPLLDDMDMVLEVLNKDKMALSVVDGNGALQSGDLNLSQRIRLFCE